MGIIKDLFGLIKKLIYFIINTFFLIWSIPLFKYIIIGFMLLFGFMFMIENLT